MLKSCSSLVQQAAAQLAQVGVLGDVGIDDVLLDPLPDLVVVCARPAAQPQLVTGEGLTCALVQAASCAA